MARRVIHNEHLTSEEKWELELEIRRNRERERREDPRRFIPHRDPVKGPTVGETLAYYAEKNRAISKMTGGVPPPDTAGEDDYLFPRPSTPWDGLNLQQLAEVHAQAASKAAQQLRPLSAVAGMEGGLGCGDPSPSTAGGDARTPDTDGPVAGRLDPPNKRKLCSMCGWAGTRYRCSRCQQASYCSQSCQRGHWAAHAADCAPQREAAAGGAPTVPQGEAALGGAPTVADLD